MQLPDHVIQDRNFPGETVPLDDHYFIRCKFTACKLVFTGEGPVHFEDCRFINCQWVFDGPAENTLDFLTALYHGLGREGKQLVRKVFDSIEKDAFVEEQPAPEVTFP